MSLLEKIQQLRKTLYDKCDRLEVAERIHWENGYNQALEDVEKLLSEVAKDFPLLKITGNTQYIWKILQKEKLEAHYLLFEQIQKWFEEVFTIKEELRK